MAVIAQLHRQSPTMALSDLLIPRAESSCHRSSGTSWRAFRSVAGEGESVRVTVR